MTVKTISLREGISEKQAKEKTITMDDASIEAEIYSKMSMPPLSRRASNRRILRNAQKWTSQLIFTMKIYTVMTMSNI